MKHLSKKAKIFWAVAIVMIVVIVPISCYLFYKCLPEIEYRAEQRRFSRVVSEASDEELFLMLRYAMYHHYVPTWEVDPYFDIYVNIGGWHRTLNIYDVLVYRGRKDLLGQIYPDMKDLRDYVHSRRGDLYLTILECDTAGNPDTLMCEEIDSLKRDSVWQQRIVVAKAIKQNLAKDSTLFETMWREAFRELPKKNPQSLAGKYFGTPLIRHWY